MWRKDPVAPHSHIARCWRLRASAGLDRSGQALPSPSFVPPRLNCGIRGSRLSNENKLLNRFGIVAAIALIIQPGNGKAPERMGDKKIAFEEPLDMSTSVLLGIG